MSLRTLFSPEPDTPASPVLSFPPEIRAARQRTVSAVKEGSGQGPFLLPAGSGNPERFHNIYDTLKNMVMRMSRFPSLLIITLVLIAGCVTPAPKETPATIPATGSVEVSSAPPGAEVYLDNIYKGTTPVTVIGEPGPHTLELRLRDHQSWSKSIMIGGGAKSYVDTALVPVPAVTSPAPPPPTSPTTLPTTRPRPTTSPVPPQTPTPWPRTILGCFVFETDARTGLGESVHLTEIWWFQPAGIGLRNGTWTYQSPKKPEVSLTGFTWLREPATDLITVTTVGGGGIPAEVHYNGNNDTITFSNVNMRTIFPRVPCQV